MLQEACVPHLTPPPSVPSSPHTSPLPSLLFPLSPGPDAAMLPLVPHKMQGLPPPQVSLLLLLSTSFLQGSPQCWRRLTLTTQRLRDVKPTPCIRQQLLTACECGSPHLRSTEPPPPSLSDSPVSSLHPHTSGHLLNKWRERGRQTRGMVLQGVQWPSARQSHRVLLPPGRFIAAPCIFKKRDQQVLVVGKLLALRKHRCCG